MPTSLLDCCNLCGWHCGVNRTLGQVGHCGAGSIAKTARSALHFWEEPCISGTNGSGTVFFSHCSLSCIYCQNHSISSLGKGKCISTQQLAASFLDLAAQAAHNLNLVTPTHFVPQIIAAIDLARGQGFNLPVVYNTSSYDTPSTIKALCGYVDIYLADFKYIDPALGKKYSAVADYPSVATNAIDAMVAQVGTCVFGADDMLKHGVIIRHLVLPELVAHSKSVIKHLYHRYGNSVYLSIMNQYTPLSAALPPPLNRKITQSEYNAVVDFAIELGVTNGFIQEGDTASESFIPQFE